ncbi:MAG TPA: penicillin-binding protein [Methylomirabilota bacterium]|nr:penicillin-binding protein [Methylomirabilota bacterium]
MSERLLAVGGAIGVGFLLVLLRLVELTVVQGDELARQAAIQHQRRSVWAPRRGEIVDRNGEPLALSLPAESLFVRTRQLPADAEKHVASLASALHLSSQEVQKTLRSSARFVWLKRQASPEEAARVRTLGITGIDSIEEDRRFYPQGRLAAPLLGFTDIDAKGLEGIERAYDQFLRGVPREVFEERDAMGQTFLVQDGVTPPEALSVRLTLDAGLQYIAEQELSRSVKDTRALAGTAIVLDPETFEILALAHVPTFDPNDPGETRAEDRRNPAISNCYEPGSTLKVLLAAAALDTSTVRPEERVFCEYGRYPVGSHVIHDHHPYGTLTFAEVLQHSSNIGAAKVGERLGKKIYHQYLRDFGLGQKTGVDLPMESPGILGAVDDWARINLVTASFGQGVAMTPLQLACAYAALANGGTLMKPYLVRAVIDADGKAVKAHGPTPVRQVVRPETAKLLVQLLEKVVEKEGTGRRASIEGVRVAGKTGTSQKINGAGGYSARGRIASFVGIVPADQPRFVILVAIDEPKTAVYGGEVAAPVFQAIARQALARAGLGGNKAQIEWASLPASPTAEKSRSVRMPLPQQAALVSTSSVADVGESAPNFLGMSLRTALRMAQLKGLHITAMGSGYVTRQDIQDDRDTGERVYALTLSPVGEGRP